MYEKKHEISTKDSKIKSETSLQYKINLKIKVSFAVCHRLEVSETERLQSNRNETDKHTLSSEPQKVGKLEKLIFSNFSILETF